MRNLSQGANTVVGGTRITVRIPSCGNTAPVVALLSADGKANGNAAVVGGATARAGVEIGSASVGLDLSVLPADRRVVVGAIASGANVSTRWEHGSAEIVGGAEPILCSLEGLGAEPAVVFCEFYIRNGEWKVRCVAQGWQGGSSAMASTWGVAVHELPTPSSPSPGVSGSGAASPGSATGSSARPGRVVLAKAGESRTISLNKRDNSCHVNLNWAAGVGGMSKWLRTAKADLDLGCMVEMLDGSKHVIQPLGNSFGSRHQSPFIWLDKDDRSGAALDGENLYVTRPDLVRRLLIFAMVYEGASDFTSVNARVTIRQSDGTETVVILDSPSPSLNWCAAVLFDRVGGDLRLTKEERYFGAASLADRHYGFGFRWVRGTK